MKEEESSKLQFETRMCLQPFLRLARLLLLFTTASGAPLHRAVNVKPVEFERLPGGAAYPSPASTRMERYKTRTRRITRILVIQAGSCRNQGPSLATRRTTNTRALYSAAR